MPTCSACRGQMVVFTVPTFYLTDCDGQNEKSRTYICSLDHGKTPSMSTTRCIHSHTTRQVLELLMTCALHEGSCRNVRRKLATQGALSMRFLGVGNFDLQIWSCFIQGVEANSWLKSTPSIG
nr:uncharacterized protein LOC112285855 [Physcomitrium patens]|eukprot:XP_024382914.1 uncharacterized protein LOC112285855 [Physcomitrella patens]